MNPEGRKPVPLIDRFYHKVAFDHPSKCWEWTANRSMGGYGMVKFHGRNRGAHRISYELWTGTEIPDGMQVMHRCDNPPCVNPFHLELGTCRDNIRDKHAKGRQPSQRGSRNNAGSRLTDDQIIEALRRLRSGEVQRQIAEDLGITQTMVSRINLGRRVPEFGVLND